MSNYTRWYRVGNVKLVQGSRTIEGTDTYWLTAGLNPGDLFTVDGAQFYEVDSITDNTHLTLKNTYAGVSVNDSAYSIIRNFTATMPADIAARTAELLGDFRKYIDTDMRSIHGKSAYELALENGYVGTESQWLESLKASGEYQALASEVADFETAADTRLTSLESGQESLSSQAGDLTALTTAARNNLVAAINELVSHQGSLSSLSTSAKSTLVAAINEVLSNEGALSSLTTSAKSTLVAALNEVKAATTTNASTIQVHENRTKHLTESPDYTNEGARRNLIYRGKCLGDKPTEAQLAAIRNGTFEDMYLGDYWNGVGNSGWTGLRWMIVHFNYYANDWGNWIVTSANATSGNESSWVGPMYRAGFTQTQFKPHVTVMQMYHASASAALNQKGGRFDSDATEWNDCNAYFLYGASGTTCDQTTGEGGYSAKVVYNALTPTFGYDHLLYQYVMRRNCTVKGIYTGSSGAYYVAAAQPFLSQLTGQTFPQSDEKFHRLTYTGTYRDLVNVNCRQFAAFIARPFMLNGAGFWTKHSKFWLRDLLGPNSSNVPLSLLGNHDGCLGLFTPTPVTYSASETSYHVHATIY